MVNKKQVLETKIPFVPWLSSAACCGYFFYSTGLSVNFWMSALATTLLLFRHKGTWTFSASIWLALAILSFGLAEVMQPAEGAMVIVNCAVIMFFSRPPYINARSTLTGHSKRASWKGRGIITANTEGTTTTFSVNLLNISANGFSCTLTDDLRLKPNERIHLCVPALKNFQSRAKVISVEKNTVHCQLQGWTISSVFEHAKLKRQVNHILKSNAGLTMVEMLVVAAIGSVIVLAISKLLLNTFELESTAKKKFWIESIKSEIINGLRGRESWQKTIASAKNSSMDCVQNLTPCNPLVNKGLIEVLDAEGGRIFDSTVPTNGFNERGEFCTSFNAVNGNDTCPFRYEVQWTPTCVGSCTNPEVRLDIALLYRPAKSNVRIDTQKHAILLYRSPIFDSLSANCSTLNGVFNPATGLCEWTRLASNCASISQILVGFDAAGNEICEPFPAFNCPPGEFIKGFDNTGAVVCTPG